MCRAPKKQPAFPEQKNPSLKIVAKYLGDGKLEEDKSQKDNSSDSDFVFMTKTTAKSSLPTVQVRINGIKGQVEADSCSTANIIDKECFWPASECSEKETEIETSEYKVVCVWPRKTDSIG